MLRRLYVKSVTARKIIHLLREFNIRLLRKIADIVIYLSRCGRQEFDLRNYINNNFNTFYSKKDKTSILQEILEEERLTHLDIGAREGVLDVVKPYLRFFEAVVCEPEPEEAERLRNSGYRVIEQPMYKDNSEVTFYHCREPAASSLYRPRGPFLDLYNPDPDYMTLFDAIDETRMVCTTISDALNALGIEDIDFLKIDAQGAELDIIKGMGNFRPLLIMAEVQYLPMYYDMPNAHEVCFYLIRLGYIPIQMTSINDKALCPIWGDGLFVPNWTTDRGRKSIRDRESRFVALMIILGQIEILKFIGNKLNFKRKGIFEKLE